MITADAVHRQLVAAGASAEMAEATLWLLERVIGVDIVRFDPRGANALSAELGTLNAVELETAAKQLAAEFGIAQVGDLCALLQMGIVWGKALRGELVPVKRADGQPSFISYLEAHQMSHKGNLSTNSIHPGYSIIFVLAFNWKYLTGKELYNTYSDKATKGGRGPFYRFAKAACKAVGIKAPSDRTIDRCLENEGLRGSPEKMFLNCALGGLASTS